jgi:hypothetical protein
MGLIWGDIIEVDLKGRRCGVVGWIYVAHYVVLWWAFATSVKDLQVSVKDDESQEGIYCKGLVRQKAKCFAGEKMLD